MEIALYECPHCGSEDTESTLLFVFGQGDNDRYYKCICTECGYEWTENS